MLYVLHSKKLNAHKIGVSKDVDKRIMQIRTTGNVPDAMLKCEYDTTSYIISSEFVDRAWQCAEKVLDNGYYLYMEHEFDVVCTDDYYFEQNLHDFFNKRRMYSKVFGTEWFHGLNTFEIHSAFIAICDEAELMQRKINRKIRRVRYKYGDRHA